MKRQLKTGREALQVAVEQAPAPDGEERLRRAFDLVLRAAEGAEEGADADTTHGQEVVDDEH